VSRSALPTWSGTGSKRAVRPHPVRQAAFAFPQEVGAKWCRISSALEEPRS